MYKLMIILGFLCWGFQTAAAEEGCPDGPVTLPASVYAGLNWSLVTLMYTEEYTAGKHCISFGDLIDNAAAGPNELLERFRNGDVQITSSVSTAYRMNRINLEKGIDDNAVVVGVILPSFGQALHVHKYIPDEDGGSKLYSGPLDLLGKKIATNQCPKDPVIPKLSGIFGDEDGVSKSLSTSYTAAVADLLYRSSTLSGVENFQVLCGEPEDFDDSLRKTSVFLVPRGAPGGREEAFWSGDATGVIFLEPSKILNLKRGDTVDLFLNDTDLQEDDFAMISFFTTVITVRQNDLKNLVFENHLNRALAAIEEAMARLRNPDFEQEVMDFLQKLEKTGLRGPIRNLIASDDSEENLKIAYLAFQELLQPSTCIDESAFKKFGSVIGLSAGEITALYDHSRTCE